MLAPLSKFQEKKEAPLTKMLFISDNLLNEGLGIMYLRAYLKANGHTVHINLLQDHRTLDDVISYGEAYDPDLVGFSVMTPQADTFIPICKLIKERTDKTVIWGGPHSMFMSAEIERYGCVDIICTGDGDKGTPSHSRAPESDVPCFWGEETAQPLLLCASLSPGRADIARQSKKDVKDTCRPSNVTRVPTDIRGRPHRLRCPFHTRSVPFGLQGPI